MDDQVQGLKGIEKVYLQELMKTRDAEEGLKAFLEKRKPVWQGKIKKSPFAQLLCQAQISILEILYGPE